MNIALSNERICWGRSRVRKDLGTIASIGSDAKEKTLYRITYHKYSMVNAPRMILHAIAYNQADQLEHQA